MKGIICKDKYTTLLDLARQAKILSGETACFKGGIQVGIPFSGYPTGVNTATAVSLGLIDSQVTIFDTIMVEGSTKSGTTTFDVPNPYSPNYDNRFSGYTYYCTFNGETGSTCYGETGFTFCSFTNFSGDSCDGQTGYTENIENEWTNPLFSAHTSGLTLPITNLSATTQTVGPFWTLTQTGMTGDYIIGTQYTGYTITYEFWDVYPYDYPVYGCVLDGLTSSTCTLDPGLGTGYTAVATGTTDAYSGYTIAIQENFSAKTLDYKGPLDYLHSKEDATVEGKLTTNKLVVQYSATSATTGYVLTQVDAIGTAEWRFNSASAATNTFVVSGALDSSDDLNLTYNTGGAVPPIDLSDLRFTGNTSGDCITDLFVTNIHGCSPITFHSPLQHNGSSATGLNSIAWGSGTTASGNQSHAEGRSTTASTTNSHAEGGGTLALGSGSHAEGRDTIAGPGGGAHAEGRNTTASGHQAHAEGRDTIASGEVSHAEGSGTTASGHGSHTEGLNTIASGVLSHAEGNTTIASGDFSHVEGSGSTASGLSSHAEGNSSATGPGSHAEGFRTISSGSISHSQGSDTIASGNYAHAEGCGVIAAGNCSHAGGESHSITNSIIASGKTSFVHFHQSSPSGIIGAYGDYTAILGGTDHNISSGSTNAGIFAGSGNTIDGDFWNSVIIGGDGNKIEIVSGDTCGCPCGFYYNSETGLCTKYINTLTGSTGLPVIAAADNTGYNNKGARFCTPGTYTTCWAGVGQQSSVHFLAGGVAHNGDPIAWSFWGDGVVPTGRLNAVGVWATLGGSPTNEWIGFSRCFNLPSDGQYLFALAGDNQIRATIDGATIVENPWDANPLHSNNFNYWWVWPIDFLAGDHVINLEGRNNSSFAAFGCEIIGPFAADTYTTVPDFYPFTAQTGIDIYTASTVFSSLDVVGGEFDTSDDKCPAGFSYDDCTNMCLITTACTTDISPNAIVGGCSNEIINSAQYGGILGGCHNIINQAQGTVILGGQNITGVTNDTAYVPHLNINYSPASGNTLNEVLVRDTDGTVKVRNAHSIAGAFSGNTSGACIEDLWVSSIHSCSPLFVNPGDEGNIYFGSTSGVSIDVAGEFITTEDLFVGDKITHKGDTNTYIQFTPDRIRMEAGGTEYICIQDNPPGGATGEIAINEGGVQMVTRIEGVNNENLFFVNGLSGFDSIGINSSGRTDAILHISGNTGDLNAVHVEGGDVFIENNQNDITRLTVQNLEGGTIGRSTMSCAVSGDSVIAFGTLVAFGVNATPVGTFEGQFLPESFNMTSAGGTFDDRLNINIGSRRGADATTRFFGGSSNFNDESLLATFFLSGLTLTDSYSGGRLNTPKLRVRDGATIGKVLTAVDNLGNVTWQPGATSFTGGSGDCITDLYVTNIHACSPLNINPNNEGNIFIGTGFTFDLTGNTDQRLGINTFTPQANLHIKGLTPPLNDNLFLIEDSTGNIVLGANDEGALAIGVDPHDIAMSGKSSLFIKGESNVSTGNFDDENLSLRVVNSSNNNILVVKNGGPAWNPNIGRVGVNAQFGSQVFLPDDVVFYVKGDDNGTTASGNVMNIADGNTNTIMQIQNDSNIMLCRSLEYGKVKIGGSSPGAKLHITLADTWQDTYGETKAIRIDGLSDVSPFTANTSNIFTVDNFGNTNILKRTTTENFTMTSGATSGYILTSDVAGNATWQPSSGITGTTYWEEGSGLKDTLGGHTMYPGAATNFSIIAGGEGNEITSVFGIPAATHNAILGGKDNIIHANVQNQRYNSIIGGEGNEIGHTVLSNASTWGAIIGGNDNKILGATNNCVLIGHESFTAHGVSDCVFVPTINIGDFAVGPYPTKFRLDDGTQKGGYVLTTDASGNADWQPPTGTTSADCMNILWASSISGCSPVTIGESIQSPTSTASGQYSLAYGYNTQATAFVSHAEGEDTIASNIGSHAEGSNTLADAIYSHAEGLDTTAEGDYSHAEGEETIASGTSSHAAGLRTIAGGDYSHASGYNSGPGNYIFALSTGSFIHQGVGEAPGSIGIDNNSINSVILGGKGHNIYGNSANSSILAGIENLISACTSSVIVGGSVNQIKGNAATSSANIVIGGSGHEIIGDNIERTVIIGGFNNTIGAGVEDSVIIGGAGITALKDETVYVPTLNISTIVQDNTIEEVLVRAANGTVQYRDVDSISGCCSTAAAPIPEAWFGTVNFDDAQGGDLNADVVDATTGRFTYIDSASPLIINNTDQGNVYIGSTSGFTYDVSTARLGIGIQVPTETLHVSGGNVLIDNDQNDSGGLVIQNFNVGAKASSIISLQADGTGGVDTDGFILYGGQNYTNLPGGSFIGSYITNALNIGTGGGSGSDRGDINIGSRKTFGQTRFFGGSGGDEAHFDDATLLGIFHTTGLTITNTRTINTDKLKVRDGATENYVLQSDSSGNATWTAPEDLKGISNISTVASQANTITNPPTVANTFCFGQSTYGWGGERWLGGDLLLAPAGSVTIPVADANLGIPIPDTLEVGDEIRVCGSVYDTALGVGDSVGICLGIFSNSSYLFGNLTVDEIETTGSTVPTGRNSFICGELLSYTVTGLETWFAAADSCESFFLLGFADPGIIGLSGSRASWRIDIIKKT